jgi:hypothetical protein
MITDLRSYKFITYILTSILIIPFAILYILIFAGLLILIGFANKFLLWPKGEGFNDDLGVIYWFGCPEGGAKPCPPFFPKIINKNDFLSANLILISLIFCVHRIKT